VVLKQQAIDQVIFSDDVCEAEKLSIVAASMMSTSSVISIDFFAVQAVNVTEMCHDFLGFIVLKSPEICFYHFSGNPVWH